MFSLPRAQHSSHANYKRPLQTARRPRDRVIRRQPKSVVMDHAVSAAAGVAHGAKEIVARRAPSRSPARRGTPRTPHPFVTTQNPPSATGGPGRPRKVHRWRKGGGAVCPGINFGRLGRPPPFAPRGFTKLPPFGCVN